MSDQVFPALSGLGWSVTRSPIFMTRVQESISGKRVRIADQSAPRHKWSLTFNFLRQGTYGGVSYAELAALYGFFSARQGRFDPFLYQDAADNAVAGQAIGVGDGVTVAFPLLRAFGGFVEPILAPNIVSAVTVGGVATTAYTLSVWGATSPGVVTFATAPAAGAAVAVSFSYYWPCTFSDDTLSFDNFMASLWSAKKVQFESVK